MAASEAAVTAVMETLGCNRAPVDWESRGWKSMTKWIKDGKPENFGDICFDHRVDWTDRGCPVAVAAADAAVDADRASIQAETAKAVTSELADLIEPFSGIGLANGATRGDVARWLHARADRIESQP